MIITNLIQKVLFTLIFGAAFFVFSNAQEGTVEYIDTSDCGGNTPDAYFFARDMNLGSGIVQKLFYPNDTVLGYTYEWDLGNGDTPTGTSNIIAPYEANSYYTVSLTETNTTLGNCIVKRTRRIKHKETFLPPLKQVYSYLETGCRTLTTSFNFITTSYNDWPILEWHFGDGTVIDSVYNPTHTYDSVGTYKPFVVYNNTTDTIVLPIGIAMKITQPPDARFTFLQKKDTAIATLRGSFETIFVGNHQYYNDTLYRFTWNPIGDSSDIYPRSYTKNTAPGPPSKDYLYSSSRTYNPSLYVYYNYGINNEECGSLFDTTIIIDDDLTNEIIVPNVVYLSESNSKLNYNHFGITSNGKTLLTFKVYSRTGTLVYEETSINIEWDCKTPHNVLLKSGVYFYTLEDDSGNSLIPPGTQPIFQVFRNDE